MNTNCHTPDQKKILPVEVVFHPNWWNKNYGIRFGKDFFFNPEVRVESDRLMRQHLYDRFGDLGLGEKDAIPRPVIGATLLAAGYIISGILGCEIRYFPDASPEVIPANLNTEQVADLEAPNIFDTKIIQELLILMDQLQRKFGYLEGDINWEGIQNVALNLRGEQLFLDFYDNPALADKLFNIIANTIIQFLDFMLSKTGVTSVSVNRIVNLVNPKINLHSNCSITMLSDTHYREFLLKYDQLLAKNFNPYGIHFCGSDMHRFIKEFARIQEATFFDVGWESDVSLCREVFPDKFLSLRLDPGRMLTKSSEVIENDIRALLKDATPLHKTGLCCVNVDYGTPDENVRKIFEVAQEYREALAVS